MRARYDELMRRAEEALGVGELERSTELFAEAENVARAEQQERGRGHQVAHRRDGEGPVLAQLFRDP